MPNFAVSIGLEEYHSHSAIGSTDIKNANRSLAHFQHERFSVSHQTKAKNFGTCLHLAILEPKLFKQNVLVMPEFSGTGMRNKKDLFLTENFGKLFLSADEYADLLLMLKSVTKHKTASSLLVGGEAELSYFWTDRDTGMGCKCRPDYRRKSRAVIDIKSTEDASLEAFSKTILHYNYHLSAAHYLNGVTEVTGEKHEEFLIIAIEKKAPYGLQVFEIDFGTLEKGQELVKRGLLKLKVAMETKSYPTYSDEIVPINIPAYGFSM